MPRHRPARQSITPDWQGTPRATGLPHERLDREPHERLHRGALLAWPRPPTPALQPALRPAHPTRDAIPPGQSCPSCGPRNPRHSPHAAPHGRNAVNRGWRRHPLHPAPPRPRQPQHHGDLHPRLRPRPAPRRLGRRCAREVRSDAITRNYRRRITSTA